MTLEQLRIFIAVAEREHVTAASQALHLTQSAVSNAIATLEERYGLKLFDRVGRGIVLNEYGRLFLAEARAVMARAGQAEALLADLGTLKTGHLSIYASQTIASYWLPERLAQFRLLYPAITLDVQIGNSHEVAEAVTQGQCEVGLVEGVVSHPLLQQECIGQDHLTIIAYPTHPLVHKTSITADDLSQAVWVMREQGSGTRSSFEDALVQAGCCAASLNVGMTLPSNEAVLNATQNGVGLAGLSEYVVRTALAAGQIVALDVPLAPRFFQSLRHRERYHTRTAQAFLALLQTGRTNA
ncbi:LysR family transcriptional regulator [Acetobacter cibinongensis]|uniref:LysR family transcriptional regulator n=1 Tax=Acetobacter cibinongensis TaxID=146475 RepID=A0A1Z5YUH4_9PROT|nr:LysR family transcriptional regulator [Acetobacter cibinongensis]OUJ02198.1 LysR family transcriptional regulator [Acetobacter cibinongensis]